MQGTRQPWQTACSGTNSVALSSLGYDVHTSTLYGHVMLCSQPPVSFHGVILILYIQFVPAWLDASSMICITSMDSGHLSTLSSQFLHRISHVCHHAGWVGGQPHTLWSRRQTKCNATVRLKSRLKHCHSASTRHAKSSMQRYNSYW